MIYRRATPEDTRALSALGRESFLVKFGHLYRPEDIASFTESTHSEAAVAAALADPKLLCQLAEAEDGTLAGYCRIALASSFPDHARGARTMELKQLYTHPARTGQGIGAALMDWAMDQFRIRGADEVHLSVWSGNHGAQRFYERYGFTKTADIVFMVGEQADHDLLFARML